MFPSRKSVVAGLTMAVLTVLGAARSVDLYWRRAEVVRTAEARAANLATILLEYMRGTFSAGDASLRQLSLHSQRVGGPGAPAEDWAPSLASARAGLAGVGSISIVDRDGVIRHSTTAVILGQSRRDQYVFRRLSADTTDAFVVDTPFLTITEPKHFVIPVGRRLTTRAGAFDGIVAITFTPEALRTFLRTIDVGTKGAVSVLHPDGYVLVREPSAADPIGESSRTNPIFDAAQRSKAGVVDGPLVADGPPMLSAFRVSDSPPLVVAVSLDRREMLADWRRQFVGWTIGFLVLVTTMAITLRALFRQMDAKAAAERELVRAQKAEAALLKASNERLENALELEQVARRDTEEAARLKDEFVMTVSHELRTPLTSIAGWVQILETGKLDAGQSKTAIETISRNARVQARLIDDLLDVSRIISGKLRLEVREVDVVRLVREAVSIVQPAADAKSLRLEARLDQDAGTIAADPDRLQQILWNLLANAIKFTPFGGRVVVSVTRLGRTIEIAVRDSGAGIATDFLPHVFDRFRQGDGGAQRSHGGLGLGLAIVRHLVELHGGTVTAESDGAGHGATFRIVLPIKQPAPAADPAGATRIETALS